MKKKAQRRPMNKGGRGKYVVAFKFADGRIHRMTLADVEAQEFAQYQVMSQSDSADLRLAGRKRLAEIFERLATARGAMLARASKGGFEGGKAKTRTAERSKTRAVARFKLLTASDRTSAEAITMMTSEGWSRSSLYRHLRDELSARKTVKRRSGKKV
jgi:hypothetical protein